MIGIAGIINSVEHIEYDRESTQNTISRKNIIY